MLYVHCLRIFAKIISPKLFCANAYKMKQFQRNKLKKKNSEREVNYKIQRFYHFHVASFTNFLKQISEKLFVDLMKLKIHDI